MTITLPEATLLEQLLKLPRLPVVAQRLDTLVADEAARRAHFIETVLECEKAEFINFAVPGFVIPVRAIFEDSLNQATLRQVLAATPTVTVARLSAGASVTVTESDK